MGRPDSARMGSTYWHYTVNELGMEDVAAQIDHLHVVKCSELRGGAAGLVAGPLAHGFQRQAAADAALSKANLPFGRSISGYADLVSAPLLSTVQCLLNGCIT